MLLAQTESFWWQTTTTCKEITFLPKNFYTLFKSMCLAVEFILKRRMLPSFTKYLCWFSLRINNLTISCSESFPHIAPSIFVQCIETFQVDSYCILSDVYSLGPLQSMGEKKDTFRVQLIWMLFRCLPQDKKNQTLGAVDHIAWFSTRFIGITGV